MRKFNNIAWYTNLPIEKECEPLELTKEYYPALYPKYDNYDAIEVSRVKDIPKDYDGFMGVPITFLTVYNPEQFSLAGVDRYIKDGLDYGDRFYVDGQRKYVRLVIKHR